jgi:hypothetical protein
VEACPHKHDVQAASELCALLVRARCVSHATAAGSAYTLPRRSQEGSTFVNPRKAGETPTAVSALPQLHGRTRDALQARARCCMLAQREAGRS